jgi:hypothetical protein
MEQVISKVRRGPMCWIYLHRARAGESHDACGKQPSFNIRDPVPWPLSINFWHWHDWRWFALVACVLGLYLVLKRGRGPN